MHDVLDPSNRSPAPELAVIVRRLALANTTAFPVLHFFVMEAERFFEEIGIELAPWGGIAGSAQAPRR